MRCALTVNLSGAKSVLTRLGQEKDKDYPRAQHEDTRNDTNISWNLLRVISCDFVVKVFMCPNLLRIDLDRFRENAIALPPTFSVAHSFVRAPLLTLRLSRSICCPIEVV